MPDTPQTIGRYQAIRLLGEGGMGAVFLCHDPLLKRNVAVKTVLVGRADSADMLERFQREAEISAQLNHPNIITVFDVGNDPAVGPFMTMEFVDGAPLSSLMEDGAIPVRTAVELLAQGAKALSAAEKAGVIHRDIKPANILVSRDWLLKLTDFGLARDETSLSLTSTGMLMGTPTHTAPELLSGDKASASTDRYAFVVTAFQLMTHGALPHKGATLQSLMSHIANSEPEMPKDMPGAAERVFLKALHKDPSRRYPTLQEFLEDLAGAYGVPEALTGVSLDRTPTPVPGDQPTEGIPISGATKLQTTSGQRRERRSREAGASAKLSGPPSTLFKGGAGGDNIPAPQELARQLELGINRPARPLPSGRVNLPPMPVIKPTDHKKLLLTVLILMGGLAVWDHYRSVQTDAALVAATPGIKPPLPGYSNVISDPDGAEVWLAGIKVGTTNMEELLIPTDEEDIQIIKPGYQTWHGRFGPDAPLPRPIQLKPEK